MTIDFNGDKALKGAAEDRLGFAAIAEAIAASLARQPTVDGLVVGIEGRWGSGKSSLVNMMLNSLRNVEDHKRPEIVEFKPWLIGDRDGLLISLFSELATAVDTIEEVAGDSSGSLRQQLVNTGEQVRNFAARLGAVGPLAKLAGSVVPFASSAGDVISLLAESAKALKNQPTLAAEKLRLRDRLSSLPRRIVVTIDDVDRLEPAEVVELLRLVRSVADFPNVVYVLCYDPGIVAHSIEVAAKVNNGYAYIEKIVQIPISVPQPESFDLRRWFREEVGGLSMLADEAGNSLSRISSVIDIEGGRYLTTPRHVVRCMDSIRFFWGALKGRIDLADLVWLHLVKFGNPKLYNWIEHYLPEAAAQASGAVMIDDEAKLASRKNLDLALEAEQSSFKATSHRLSEFLPGVDGFSFLGQDAAGVYTAIPREKIMSSIQATALASPDHYRLYFAIEQPRHAPRHIDFEHLFAALDTSTSEVCKLLSEWHAQTQSTGVTKAEVMLNRALDWDIDLFSPGRSIALLVALSDQIDDLSIDRDPSFGEPQIWLKCRRILNRLLPTLGGQREQVVCQIFNGRAVDWLTSLFRDELFAHGHVEGHKKGEPLLEPEELGQITPLMLARYRSMGFEDWKQLRRPVSALFAWYQAGDPDGPRTLVSDFSKTDAGLIDVLTLLRGNVRPSGGEYGTLKKSTLSYFMDYSNARNKIEALARDSSDQKLRSLAIDLNQSFKFSEDL